jgi:hypothetical protein
MLIAANDYRALILPQVENTLTGFNRVEQVFLQGQVMAGIVLLRTDDVQGMEHVTPPIRF